MYVGMLLMLVGWGIYLGNIASFIMLPIFILYMNRFQIMPEETFMAEKFGLAYQQYKNLFVAGYKGLKKETEVANADLLTLPSYKNFSGRLPKLCHLGLLK